MNETFEPIGAMTEGDIAALRAQEAAAFQQYEKPQQKKAAQGFLFISTLLEKMKLSMHSNEEASIANLDTIGA